MEERALSTTPQGQLQPNSMGEEIYGFEEVRSSDIVIPRIKVVNGMSPEIRDKAASIGDIINSLTKEDVSGKQFVPVKITYSGIRWNPDRADDKRILCSSQNGVTGSGEEGTRSCKTCPLNKFDNTKTGPDAQPKCTTYMNFIGFFVGESSPVVLSFAKTNYNEGRKLLSIAKSLRCNLWNYWYSLSSKEVTKNGNTWFNIITKLGQPTSDEDRAFALDLYRVLNNTDYTIDYEDVATVDNVSDEQTESEI